MADKVLLEPKQPNKPFGVTVRVFVLQAFDGSHQMHDRLLGNDSGEKDLAVAHTVAVNLSGYGSRIWSFILQVIGSGYSHRSP